MKKIILLIFLLHQITSVFSQEKLFVLAKSGLNIRMDSNLQSEKIGKFNYAEKIEVLKKTNLTFKIIDKEKTIIGEWYKVKGKTSDNKIAIGYVFSGFLTKGIQKSSFKFVNYNDETDYFLLNAEKEKSLHQFINDKNKDRSYLKGDIIEIKWKKDRIYISGDGETKDIADWIISTNKIQNGKLSDFREKYKHKIEYYIFEDSYDQNFLDHIYLLTEYYIANSENKLIKKLIQENEILEYSIENTTRNNKEYVLIGIGYSFEHKTNKIQWLYYDKNEPGELYLYNKIYEYDLNNDNLIEFNKY